MRMKKNQRAFLAQLQSLHPMPIYFVFSHIQIFGICN
ncbi:MAG: hypothetical protein RLZZ42_1060 [Bacteroidota bacterium]